MIGVPAVVAGAVPARYRNANALAQTHRRAPQKTKEAVERATLEWVKQTRTGNNWYVGMKTHIGVDADPGLVHTVAGTPANMTGRTHLPHPPGQPRLNTCFRSFVSPTRWPSRTATLTPAAPARCHPAGRTRPT